MSREGEIDLLEILREILPHRTFHELYVLAGDLAEWLVRRGSPLPSKDGGWQPLGKGIEIQDLTVRRKESPYGGE